MKKERKVIPLGRILLNEGQLDWLPRNPRQWTQTDIDRTAASIREDPDFLEDRPILVVPYENGLFIAFAGNLRHEGSVAAKRADVPCVVYYPQTEEDFETVKRRAMKDNGSFGSWDYDALANEWSDLPLGDWGVSAWDGFNGDPGQPTEGAPGEGAPGGGGRVNGEDDDFDPDQEVEHRVKRGEIWALGKHRLMCGDSTSSEDVRRLMGGVTSDLWLTDPPYIVNYGQNMITGDEKDRTIMNDNMDDASFHDFLLKVNKNAVEHMKPGATFYICHADSEGYNFRGAAREAGLTVRQCLIWKKDSLVLGRQDYQWIHEPILVGWKDGAAHSWYNDRKQTTVLEFDRPKKSELHPTMKPVPLFVYLIQNSTKEGDVVMDLFGGSGTTIIACEQTGRVGYTMELDEHYASVIVDRWEKYTGLTAERIQ